MVIPPAEPNHLGNGVKKRKKSRFSVEVSVSFFSNINVFMLEQKSKYSQRVTCD